MSELPQQWSWARLEQLSAPDQNSMTDGPFGSKLKTSHYVSAGPRVIRLGNIGIGHFNSIDEAYITPEHFAQLKKHEVFPGDLLIAALAEPVGRTCLVPENIGPAIVKADCIRFKPNSYIEAKFLMYWMNSPQGRMLLEEASHGMGRLRINLTDLRNHAVPVAPAAEQRRIVAKLDRTFARTARAREQLSHVPNLVKRYKQAVLTAAFRGALTAGWRAANPTVQPASSLIAATPAPAQPRGGREATNRVIAGKAALAVNHPGLGRVPGRGVGVGRPGAP
jgi:type I restriction enzyme, S subunit